jgi:preprotein translocase subunit YajC
MHVLALLAADESNNSSGGLIQIGILLLIPLAMYFLMIRPQRRRMREQQSMQSSLEIGDEVMTSSGIYGFITGFEDDIAWVEIDDDVQVRVSRGALSGKVTSSTSDSTAPASSSTTDAAGSSSASGASSAGASAKKVNPTVKGVRAGRADRAEQQGLRAETVGEPADADAAERTVQE